jgi:hypothetical protein
MVIEKIENIQNQITINLAELVKEKHGLSYYNNPDFFSSNGKITNDELRNLIRNINKLVPVLELNEDIFIEYLIYIID